MVDRFHRNGIMVDKKDDEFPEADEEGGSSPATPKPAAPGSPPAAQQSEAERQAAVSANRARMMAAMGKKA
jgi:hypothetical protein